jgi:glycosyltransferase involved in cell wall biosynthesis
VLLDFPERREQMGRAAQAHVAAHLSWEASVGRLRQLYAAHERKDDWIPPMGMAQEAT